MLGCVKHNVKENLEEETPASYSFLLSLCALVQIIHCKNPPPTQSGPGNKDASMMTSPARPKTVKEITTPLSYPENNINMKKKQKNRSLQA